MIRFKAIFYPGTKESTEDVRGLLRMHDVPFTEDLEDSEVFRPSVRILGRLYEGPMEIGSALNYHCRF